MPTASPALLRQITCPHCWKDFHPEDVLWVAAHGDLLGDLRLGPEHPQRFLPSRFNVAGHALDACDFECHQLACPHCHLIVPRALLELRSLFLSILGTPACGKSYYLAALTWELRKVLPGNFALTFTDVDPFINQLLTANEQALFLNPRAGEHQYLTNLIGKNKLHGEMYDTVSHGNQLVSYPRPYLFSFQPKPNHPRAAHPEEISRVVCLYDNAGEHFQPGRDSPAAPVTQHLGRAEVLLFLFDPTQDPRFGPLLELPGGSGSGTRQDQVLVEAAARIRRQLGLSHNAPHDCPLIVVLTKCDAWLRLLADPNMDEPWERDGPVRALDVERIERLSARARTLLHEVCPELVQVAEELSRQVLYVPVSALGHSPVQQADGPAIRPSDIRPIWVTVPVLYAMHRWMRGLIQAAK
jgi:hypothetical protein